MGKIKQNYFVFEHFSSLPRVVHGISSKQQGNMRQSDTQRSSIGAFANLLGIADTKLIGMQQVHSATIQITNNQQFGLQHKATDGLLTEEKNIFLYGKFADCVPVLFYDKKTHKSGVVHSGWRGTYQEIARCMIEQMQNAGSDPKNILVGIGPSIRECCYDIPKERFGLFKKKFPKIHAYMQHTEGKYYLDLPKLIRLQLIASGVVPEQIEDADICTSDQSDMFYSYRKTKDKTQFETFAAIIGTI